MPVSWYLSYLFIPIPLHLKSNLLIKFVQLFSIFELLSWYEPVCEIRKFLSDNAIVSKLSKLILQVLGALSTQTTNGKESRGKRAPP